MSDRGVSTVVSYVLALGIVALVTSTLVVGFAPFVTNQQHDTVHANLEVLGNDIAGDIDSADRLATEAGDNGTVELRTRLPDRVGGSTYEIEFHNRTDEREYPGYHYDIELRSTDPETTATVRVRSNRSVETEPAVLEGGILKIELASEEEVSKLVIQNV